MKKIQVNWMNKKLCQIYPYATKWEVFKYRTLKIFAKIVELSVISVSVFLVVSVGFYFGMKNKVEAEVEVVKVFNDTLSLRIEELKTELINELVVLESDNVGDDEALIVYDDNKNGTLPRKDKVSIGCMQFKIGTIQKYVKELRNEELTNYEATMIALNCEQSKQLSKDIIFEVKGGLWNWSVATEKMGNKVEFIRSLSVH